jgi:pimeloyl-ACP methyl ester carboxylesterase
MPHLDRHGVQIYYQQQGDGPPILLSHGYGSTSHMWEGQMGAFSDRYKVISWDMRGHGQTDSPEDQDQYSEAATVDDMVTVLDTVGEASAIIGGLSLGGYMSLAFYLKHPERTKALMLFDTGPGYRNPKARDGWNDTAEKRAQAFETRGLEAAGTGSEVRTSLHRSADGLARAARGMLAQFDSRVMESLTEIKVPALVLVGANDQPFIGATDYMTAKIPGCVRATIPDAGHAANIDQPEAFNEAVESFLATL